MSEAYRPIKFVDEMEDNNHILVLYDNEKYANAVIARYFLDGLEKGGSCIFFTDGEPKVVEETLSAEGIDVEKYKSRNQLRVFQIDRSDEGKVVDILATLKMIRSKSSDGMKGPFRFAGRTISDIETKQGMQNGMILEKTGQEHFAEFDNAQMCYYDIRKMEKTMRDEWIKGLLESHHQVIYASDPDKAVGFETALLEAGE